MAIKKVIIKVTTAGSSGSATGTGSEPVPLGLLHSMYFDFHASAPGTTDTEVSAPGDPAATTLMTLTNGNTDGWFFPGSQMDDASAAAITGAYVSPIIHGNVLQIALSQCDALTDALTAYCFIEV